MHYAASCKEIFPQIYEAVDSGDVLQGLHIVLKSSTDTF